MSKTPILANANYNLYSNEKYIIERINESDNTIDTYSDVNDDIINNMLDTKLVSNKIMDYYESKNKLLGTKIKKKKDKKNEDIDELYRVIGSSEVKFILLGFVFMMICSYRVVWLVD